MRTFYFKARNIGQEKYLTYTMGEECELDEDVLDYIEENSPSELVSIIYEEDDDYDYLTYDVSGKVSLAEYINQEIKLEEALVILKNLASSVISIKEQAIHLAYILMNRDYIFVDKDSKKVTFICLPVYSEAAVSAEFKGFVRHLLANMKYDVTEDLNYVGKLLTYINGENFNLRGLVGLSEALMEEAGIEYEESEGIEADGVEVVSSEVPDFGDKEENVSDFMNSVSDEPLPEIGDDEEEEVDEADEPEVEEKTESEVETKAEPEVETKAEFEAEEETETEAESETVSEVKSKKTSNPKDGVPTLKPETKKETKGTTENLTATKTYKVASGNKRETDVNLLKSRFQQMMGEKPETEKSKGTTKAPLKSMEELDNFFNSKPPVVKKTQVKVNRAALIQSAAEHETDVEDIADGQVPVIEDVYEESEAPAEVTPTPKSNSVLSMSVDDVTTAPTTQAVPKATPYLIRVNTEERIMLGKLTFKIGKASRGVDYTVGGNGAISRQHAIITQKDGVCYIRDNKSTNHTYVNDKMIEEGEEEILTHDSMIKLGDEEFIFKIR